MHQPPPRSCAIEQRVRVLAVLAGRARTPARRGERARVDGLDRRAEELDPFQKERPLLREEDGEALVRRDRGHVRLHLREVGIDRGVDGHVGVRGPLEVEPRVRRRPAVDEVGAEVRRAARRCWRAVTYGASTMCPPAGQTRAARPTLPEVADEAVRVARQLVREQLIAAVARIVAVKHEAPLVGIRAVDSAATRTGCAPRRVQPCSCTLAAESQKKSGELSSPAPASSVTASYCTPRAVTRKR